jgi:hypothetical protein
MALVEAADGHWRVKVMDPKTKEEILHKITSQGEYSNVINLNKGNIIVATHGVTIHNRLYLAKLQLDEEYYWKGE